MTREGRMPTPSEDICSACEVQESCDQGLDNIIECAHMVIHDLLKPKPVEIKRYSVMCHRDCYAVSRTKFSPKTVEIGQGSTCGRTGIISVHLDMVPLRGLIELLEIE